MPKSKPLLIAGCFHIGAKTADMEMAKAYVDFIRENDGFCILLADNHECAVPRKAWMMFEQNLTPQEQLDYSVELFSPIKRNIKGAVTGNHAWRAYHDAGIELDKEMMTRLGLLQYYFGFQGFIEIPYGNQTYKIAFAHGTTSGRNVFNNCEKISASFPNADIYATSHNHLMAATSKQVWQFNKGKLDLRQYYYVSTGSLLNYPLYAGHALYQPQPKGFAIAWLHPDKYHVDMDISGKIPGYDIRPRPNPVPPTIKKKEKFTCKVCGGNHAVHNGYTSGRGNVKQRLTCSTCNRKRIAQARAKPRVGFIGPT